MCTLTGKTGKTRVSRNLYSTRPIISYVPRNIVALVVLPFETRHEIVSASGPIAISAAGSARIICLGSYVAEDEIEPYREQEGHRQRNGVGENGRKRERKKVRAGSDREKQQLQQPITYRAGSAARRGGDSEPGGVISGAREMERKREIIITRIRRLVRARRPSAEFGHVARVPRPHHHVSRYPFRARKFLRSSAAA